jgi:uncharacterized protein YndB with AHSA1/START domain
MTERSTQHATFVIERTYDDASPARVFAAWADKEAKARWFGDPDGPSGYELDFRVGGREVNRGGPPGGPVYTYDARYADIVPNQRIVYSYTMDCEDARISVSVTTVEFKAAGTGTQLTFTELGVFLDGADTPQMREHGTNELLDSLGAALSGTAATA